MYMFLNFINVSTDVYLSFSVIIINFLSFNHLQKNLKFNIQNFSITIRKYSKIHMNIRDTFKIF